VSGVVVERRLIAVPADAEAQLGKAAKQIVIA
jgi:hypothetical protein